MNTAKDLAYKAFCEHLVVKEETLPDGLKQKIKDQFEIWWSKYYGNSVQPEFFPETSVFIDGKRFIKAE
jgi:hypothetical protein